MKPTLGGAFLYYLKAFDSDLATTLETMGGNTLPDAYDISIRAENLLIQGGKPAPRPMMPLLSDVPIQQPVVSPIPTTTSSHPLIISPIASIPLMG